MKKEIVSLSCALAIAGSATIAFAGAYGEPEQREEMPASPPPVVAPAPAPAPAPAKVLREFAGFMTDPETSTGLWAELGTMYGSETDFGPDIDLVHTFLHLSYGQKLWEAGLLLPYEYINQDHAGSDDGLGNMDLWVKVIPLRTDVYQAGLGLVTGFPTNTNSMGPDHYSFEPFVTGALAAGPASLRATFGYTTSTGSGDDNFDYEVAALGLAHESDTYSIALRGEIVGEHYIDADLDPVSLVPGLDIIFPIGGMDLMVRPSGGIGLSDDAPDWQLGVSLALAQTQS